MKFKIPFIKPNFPNADELADDYRKIVESNWFTNFGPYEQKFSGAAAGYIGGGVHATTISNCTLGLEAATSLLFDSDKKKVIMPSFTFAAGAEALIRNGFEPIFIDITKDSWQPNINQAELLIEEYGSDIAGILLCNIFGVGNKNIDDWERLSKHNNLPLIIDSAAGFGSRYSDNEMVGTRGDCEVFSMHATKPFAIGEGGLVVSRNKEFIDKVRSWQNFGFESDRNIHRIGTNAKLQEINAAIGLHQLRDFEERLDGRRQSLVEYKKTLSNTHYSYQENDKLSTVPFASVLFQNQEEAERVYENLLGNGVEARRYYSPLHLQGILMKYATRECSLDVSIDVASRIVSLPVHDTMADEDIDYVLGLVRDESK